jgi:predicted alpha/beta-fold hydrolase
MRRIIGNTAALADPFLTSTQGGQAYTPTWWCKGTAMNAVIYMVREIVHYTLFPLKMRRKIIERPDGGIVSLDYADDDAARALPNTAPVMGIIHTIAGNASDFIQLMRAAIQRGFLPVVLNRRGHSGLPLKSPNFSTIGCVADTLAMFQVPLGLSACTSLVSSYT